MVSDFTDLKVWQKSHEAVMEIYRLVEKFPGPEKYRITDQLIRAVTSVPANIAEGFGRYTRKEFINFLVIARGSAYETRYFMVLAKDLKYITLEEWKSIESRLSEVGKMLNGLIKSIRSKG